MKDIIIIIAAHKKVEVSNDPMYLPLHVGKEGKEEIGFIGDNTGENISIKNRNYCELTGTYWAWKNTDSDYIGLVQYRRYFKGKKKGKGIDGALSIMEADALLDQADIVLPKRRNYIFQTLKEHFEGYDFTQTGDFENYRDVVHAIDESYDDAFSKVMDQKTGHMFNMFIMSRKLFNEFCLWEFSVLEEFESRIDPKRARLVGYAAEHLLDIWITKKGYKSIECAVLLTDKSNDLFRKMDFISRIIGIKHRFITL